MRSRWLFSTLIFFSARVLAQTTETRQDEAVGESINYVFATELGSGVYDLDGRTLQIYRLTYREGSARGRRGYDRACASCCRSRSGSSTSRRSTCCPKAFPTRVDSFSVVPGLELDYLLPGDWHVIPYVRAGVERRVEQRRRLVVWPRRPRGAPQDWHGWDSFVRSELSLAGVGYRQDVPRR